VTVLPSLAGLVGGAIVGSFLATLCLRWPQGEQATTGRSRCDGCGRKLGSLDLVPVLSFVLAGGRCRSCGASIDRLHVQVELAAALLSGLALLLEPNGRGLALAIFWLLLLAPAVLDARHFWLPDRLTMLVAAAGLLLGGLVSGHPLNDRLIGGAIGFLVLGAIGQGYRYLRGRTGLGAGDPKLLGAIGLWTGWQALPPLLLLASLAGLAAALVERRSALDRMPLGTLLALAAIAWTALPSDLLDQIARN